MPVYSDVNLFLGAGSPNTLVTDADSVNQNIMLICTTPIRSKWFRPRIGSNIPEYLFDPVDDISAQKIRTEILTLFPRNGELRITVESVIVIPVPDEQVHFVSMTYTSPYLDPSRVKFDFNLAR
jgi:phage baseplate assembly protein W